ncbi:hypothetical protein DRW07_06700 [Alteromonas sediminis]|uniref:Uncharacterized protein n=1 Tax=Alteromonas sediminis TaxID=2259342 RepID=A0A3N5Y891_9ALTE|nr:hypothetical protein [Alteromonas sediminis]RPJ67219.1 hypothetical protein DRW07_06700 [Alteromonas sediminis]
MDDLISNPTDSIGAKPLRKSLEEEASRRVLAINSLPKCGKFVAFHGFDIYPQKALSTFVVSSDEIVPLVLERAAEIKGPATNDENILKNFIVTRNTEIASCTIIPFEFARYSYYLLTLAQQNIGTVYCRECKRTYRTSDVSVDVEAVKTIPGWSYQKIICLEKHLLLREKGVRFF